MEEDLERHLKKCLVQTRMREQMSEPTYVENVNKPFSPPPELPAASTRSGSRSLLAQSLGPCALLDLISKVERQYSEMQTPKLVYQVPSVCQPFLHPDGRRPFKLKHVLQQASITGFVLDRGLLNTESNPPLVIEFGAGKAYLSSMISDCTNSTKFILVDNQAFKLKAERTMKSEKRLEVRRIRADLKDFSLIRLPEIQNSHWLVIGKHLCGGSTDYALSACRQATRETDTNHIFKGLFISTCCHHRCDWESYSAKQPFLRRGFCAEEFELISWMTGWALCDHQSTTEITSLSTMTANEIRQHVMQQWIPTEGEIFWRVFPKDYRESVGMKCKQLIDVCRMEWLNEQGFNSDLSLYVPHDISPENRLLSAMP